MEAIGWVVLAVAGFFLLTRRATQPAVAPAPAPASSTGTGLLGTGTGAPPGTVVAIAGRIAPSSPDPVVQYTSQAAAAAANELAPGTGGFIGDVASTIGQSALDIVHGQGDAGDVATVAFLPVAVNVAAFNLAGKIFGWNAKPLDAVDDVLLAVAPDGWTGHDNVPPPGATVYAMDASGMLHAIPPAPPGAKGDDIWSAGYSWREIIAVPAEVLAQFPIGFPMVKAQMSPMSRPSAPADIRIAFGSMARFKVGTQELHGPWELRNPKVTLIGVHGGAPEGPGDVVYILNRPWEFGHGAYAAPWAWKVWITSPAVAASWGWELGDTQWVSAERAAAIPSGAPWTAIGPVRPPAPPRFDLNDPSTWTPENLADPANAAALAAAGPLQV
jgi:hypothetical protein